MNYFWATKPGVKKRNWDIGNYWEYYGNLGLTNGHFSYPTWPSVWLKYGQHDTFQNLDSEKVWGSSTWKVEEAEMPAMMPALFSLAMSCQCQWWIECPANVTDELNVMTNVANEFNIMTIVGRQCYELNLLTDRKRLVNDMENTFANWRFSAVLL